MRTVFADAGYWIALLDERDELNRLAEVVTHRLQPLLIVTTEMVLVEMFSHVSGAGA